MLLWVLCLNIYSTNESGKVLFCKAENKAIAYRKDLAKKNIFVDPLVVNSYTYNIFKKTSPELLDNTNLYIDSLLSLFNNKLIPRDYYTDFDILLILYNLCIDDYIVVINKVYELYKKKAIVFNILENVIIQEMNLSNLIIKNYQNNELRKILSNILSDIQTGKIVLPNNSNHFIDDLKDILSGKSWNMFEKYGDQPLINKKCFDKTL